MDARLEGLMAMSLPLFLHKGILFKNVVHSYVFSAPITCMTKPVGKTPSSEKILNTYFKYWKKPKNQYLNSE